MRVKSLFAAAVAACMMIQPCMVSYAAKITAETTAAQSTVEPGFASNGNMTSLGPGYNKKEEADKLGPAGPGAQGVNGSSAPAVNAGPNAMTEPWVKYGNSYVDDAGNIIEGALLRGISVSKWQGNVDWAKVANDDISFALIRMGSFGFEGEYTMDETYDQNMRGAKANGVHTTPYVYLQTRTVEEAKAAARFALEKAVPYEITYPLAVDIESESIMSLSRQELTDVVNAFCKVIEDAGYTPIIYSDYYKFRDEMYTDQFQYDLWLARYGGDHNMPGRTMWQCTDKGQVDGIKGNVCLEFAFKDYAAMQVTNRSDYTPGQWEQVNNTWYFSNGGNRYTGWVKPDGNWYYLDPGNGGMMVANTTMVIDGVSYTFSASGAMQ